MDNRSSRAGRRKAQQNRLKGRNVVGIVTLVLVLLIVVSLGLLRHRDTVARDQVTVQAIEGLPFRTLSTIKGNVSPDGGSRLYYRFSGGQVHKTAVAKNGHFSIAVNKKSQQQTLQLSTQADMAHARSVTVPKRRPILADYNEFTSTLEDVENDMNVSIPNRNQLFPYDAPKKTLHYHKTTTTATSGEFTMHCSQGMYIMDMTFSNRKRISKSFGMYQTAMVVLEALGDESSEFEAAKAKAKDPKNFIYEGRYATYQYSEDLSNWHLKMVGTES